MTGNDILSKNISLARNKGNWKGGRIKRKDGYIMRYCPDHPRATKKVPYVLEHILVMEAELGRYLKEKERVHHKNRKRDDNRIENLELLESQSIHARIHMIGNSYSLGNHKDMSDRFCYCCGSHDTEWLKPKEYHTHKNPIPVWSHLPYDKENWYCLKCYNKLIWRYRKMKRL